MSRRRAPGGLFRWVVLTPFVALLAFIAPVFLLQLYVSLHSWTVYLTTWWDAEFVGFDMFREVLTDPRFGWAILRSLVFAGLSTAGCFVVGFGLALLMAPSFRGHGVFYTLFLLPMLTVPIVIAYTFEMLLYQKGPVNGILSALLGTDVTVMWLADPRIAVLTTVLLEVWNWTPFVFIILLAGLAGLPRELERRSTGRQREGISGQRPRLVDGTARRDTLHDFAATAVGTDR